MEVSVNGVLITDATITGSVTIAQPVAVTGPLTDAQLRAVPVPVSGSVSISGSVAVTGPLTDAQLRAVPVPVSGTVTATGPLTDAELRALAVAISAAALPLPAGAATSALQTQPGVDIGDVTVNNAAGGAAVNIQDGGNSITVDDGGSSLTIDGSVSLTGQETISNIAQVAVSNVQVEVLAANVNRKSATIQNTGSNNIRIGVTGITATSGLQLLPNKAITIGQPFCSQQAIYAIRESADSTVSGLEGV